MSINQKFENYKKILESKDIVHISQIFDEIILELYNFDEYETSIILKLLIDVLQICNTKSRYMVIMTFFDKNPHRYYNHEKYILSVLTKYLNEKYVLSEILSSSINVHVYEDLLANLRSIANQIFDKFDMLKLYVLLKIIENIIEDNSFTQLQEKSYNTLIQTLEYLSIRLDSKDDINKLKLKFLLKFRFSFGLNFETYERTLIGYPLNTKVAQVLRDKFMDESKIYINPRYLAWVMICCGDKKKIERFCLDKMDEFIFSENKIFEFLDEMINRNFGNFSYFFMKNSHKVFPDKYLREHSFYKKIRKICWDKLTVLQKIGTFLGI